MPQLALGLAAPVALAIIVIGALYLSRPRAATLSLGLPLPEEGPNIAWLRLKGVRDIASGLAVLAFMVVGWLPHGRHHPARGSHHPHRRHAGHSCGERLGKERLRHARPDGAADDSGRCSPDYGSGIR
jgi:hypothetical protein